MIIHSLMATNPRNSESPPSDLERFEQLLRARHACITIESNEERHILDLLHGALAHDNTPYLIWTITNGLRSGVFETDTPLPDTEHPAAALYHLAHQTENPTVCVMLDLSPHLSDERTLRTLRETLHSFSQHESTLILIDHQRTLPPVITASATPFELTLPDEAELEQLIRTTLREAHRRDKINITLTKRDFRIVIRNLRGLDRSQAKQIIIDAIASDRKFDAADINTMLAAKRKRLHHDGILEFVETPLDLSSIGGLRHLKKWLKDRNSAFDEEAAAYGLTPPRGVLLLGVQGAGKSLCAKAIAAAWQRPLLRLDPGALYDRYIGESEKRLRDTLTQAEVMAPIVLWIDEIEKGFASAAAHSTDGGLSQRMFGTLLSWMQEHTAPVFLVATANNVDALPPELLRKGRFDEIFFVDLPRPASRKQIFTIHLKKRDRNPDDFDLPQLVNHSDGYSGAEIEQAIIAALHTTYSSGRKKLDTESIITALNQSPPLSVTMRESVARLRSWAADRCTPAD